MAKACLTNHTWSISHHIIPLVINALEVGHTHTHTYRSRHVNQSNFKKPGAYRPVAGAPGLKIIYSASYVQRQLLEYRLRTGESQNPDVPMHMKMTKLQIQYLDNLV